MVQFGVHTGLQQTTIPELREVWRRAEQLSFDWISIWDHFYPSTLPLDDPCHEAVAAHAALAVCTERPRVGSLVYSAGYRHPAVLANAMATVDHLSGGRLEFGIGAGWHQAEYDAYGIPFEAPAVRLRRLAESIEIIRALWSEPEVTYDGEFFTLRNALCSPKPVQAQPRIWVGASGEKVGLPLAGRLGDAWNTPFPSPEDFARKREIVLQHTADPDRFTVGVNVGLLAADDDASVDAALRARFGPGADVVRPSTIAGSSERMIEHVARYVDAGADWVIFAIRPPFELDALERVANEVLPHFRSAKAPFMSEAWLATLSTSATAQIRRNAVPVAGRIVFEELFSGLGGADTGYRLVLTDGGVEACSRISRHTGDADVAIRVDGHLASQLALLEHDDPRYHELRRQGEEAGAFSFTGDPHRAATLGAALDGLHDVLARVTC